MKLPPDSPGRDSVDQIGRAAERAAALTRQLLAFSRQQVLEPQLLDLNLLVADIEKMLQRLIGENVRLITILQPGLYRVLADSGQIDQIIMNLAVNGRDAMPQGGSLTLQTRDLDLDAAHAKAESGLRPGRYVLLSVSDTGCGMTPEVQARIFEPFFTTKGLGQGTGLACRWCLASSSKAGGTSSCTACPVRAPPSRFTCRRWVNLRCDRFKALRSSRFEAPKPFYWWKTRSLFERSPLCCWRVSVTRCR